MQVPGPVRPTSSVQIPIFDGGAQPRGNPATQGDDRRLSTCHPLAEPFKSTRVCVVDVLIKTAAERLMTGWVPFTRKDQRVRRSDRKHCCVRGELVEHRGDRIALELETVVASRYRVIQRDRTGGDHPYENKRKGRFAGKRAVIPLAIPPTPMAASGRRLKASGHELKSRKLHAMATKLAAAKATKGMCSGALHFPRTMRAMLRIGSAAKPAMITQVPAPPDSTSPLILAFLPHYRQLAEA